MAICVYPVRAALRGAKGIVYRTRSQVILYRYGSIWENATLSSGKAEYESTLAGVAGSRTGVGRVSEIYGDHGYGGKPFSRNQHAALPAAAV